MENNYEINQELNNQDSNEIEELVNMKKVKKSTFFSKKCAKTL